MNIGTIFFTLRSLPTIFPCTNLMDFKEPQKYFVKRSIWAFCFLLGKLDRIKSIVSSLSYQVDQVDQSDMPEAQPIILIVEHILVPSTKHEIKPSIGK